MDVCLVNMPYSRVELSSIALGLLQSVLERDGLRARSVYANLLFADEIGLQMYDAVSRSRPRLAVADWTFSHIAFPDFEPDEEAFFDLVVTLHSLYRPTERRRFAAMLRKVRDAATGFVDRLATLILRDNPRMVGCTSTFCQHAASLALLRRIREQAPHVVTLLGGANCETVMGRATHKSFDWVDYVVSGEADGLIARLAKEILHHGRNVPARALAKGVFGPVHRTTSYPTSNGSGVDDAPRAVSPSLDELPVPNFDDFFATLHSLPILRKTVVPGLTVETSRGCWWGQRKQCTFCGFNGHEIGFRTKPYTQVLDELGELHQRYHVNRFETVDNILDMRYFKTLLPELKKAGRPYRIFFETKPNLQQRHVKALCEAGVIWIQAGIESLHTKGLALMSKGHKAWHNVQFLKWCRQYGLRTHWNLLYDMPGEEDSWHLETAQRIPLLTHLEPALKLVPLELCRYSQYHERAEEYGLCLQPSEPYRYVYPVEEPDLRDLVYFLEDEQRARIARMPLMSSLLEGCGIEALRKEFSKWLMVFWSENRPLLSMADTPDGLHIRDTRPDAVAPFFSLTGVERNVYLLCDAAPTTELLLAHASEHGIDSNTLDKTIVSLLDKKLLIELDNRLIALALREPVADLPDRSEYPGGLIDMGKDSEMRRNLA